MYQTIKKICDRELALKTEQISPDIIERSVLLGTNYFGRQSQLTDIKL
jgi:hypothetical protein